MTLPETAWQVETQPHLRFNLSMAALIADGVARLINREGVYHQLAKRYAKPDKAPG